MGCSLSLEGKIGFAGNVVHLSGGEPMDTVTLRPGDRFDASVMRVNTDAETIYRNIRSNLAAQLPQLTVYAENPQHVAVVGGGWSLSDPEVYEQLRRLYFDGAAIVALNGSAKWLMERNLRPSMHIVLDARPENLEFIRDPIPNCKYFLASQVHPSLIEAVKDRDAYLFHAMPEDVPEVAICDDYYGKRRWVRVPACSSVGVTSILALRCLGFRYQHLFGIDSCYRADGTHHAFPQALNENEGRAWFRFGQDGREFLCSPWMAAQARSFLEMIVVNHEHISLAVYGDGLIAYLLKTAAEMPAEPEKLA